MFFTKISWQKVYSWEQIICLALHKDCKGGRLPPPNLNETVQIQMGKMEEAKTFEVIGKIYLILSILSYGSSIVTLVTNFPDYTASSCLSQI